MKFIVFRGNGGPWYRQKIHRVVDKVSSLTLCGRRGLWGKIIFVKNGLVIEEGDKCKICFSKTADSRAVAIKTAERLMSKP